MPTYRSSPAHYLTGSLLILSLLILICYPLCQLLFKSMLDLQGNFVGIRNFITFIETPGLATSLSNTLFIGVVVTIITLLITFIIAYAITHSRFYGKTIFSKLCLLPLFVPSLFPAIGIIYLFGDQGIIKNLLGQHSLYGELGIILGCIIYTMPHALLLLIITLRDIDHRLYDAARLLGAGPFRRFITITLPNATYGIISAVSVIFILTITDFGIPKVLGGNYAVLSTEIYKQIIGLQNFPMAATTSIVLLIPTIMAFILDRWMKNKQKNHQSSPPIVSPQPIKDCLFTLVCWLLIIFPLLVIGMVLLGGFIGFWPYDLSLTLENYQFEKSLYGFQPFINSIILATATACIGTSVIFVCSYLTERGNIPANLKKVYQLLAMLPLSIPGTVLGLSLMMAFNPIIGDVIDTTTGNMLFLIISTVVHFYTVCHLSFSGSLARLNPNYENAGKMLGVSTKMTFFNIIIPLQKNVLLEVCFYLFVNALTTISVVIFIYSADTIPASVAILHMFDSGEIAEASAMGSLIFATALIVQMVMMIFSSFFSRK